MGVGSTSRIGGGNKAVKDGVANVTGNALWVRVVPSGAPINVNVLSLPEPVEVEQAVHDLLNCNATLQLVDVDVLPSAGFVATPTRVPFTEHGSGLGLANAYFPVLGAFEIPGTVIVDPTLATAAGVSAGPLSLNTGPGVKLIVSLFAAQVFDNITTAANSSSVITTPYRWALLYNRMTEAGNATDLRFISQFSPDGGTNWHDFAVDQMVDLRYVDPQMPLNECVPYNYVIGSLFRLRIVARGTSAVNTYTVTAHIELIS